MNPDHTPRWLGPRDAARLLDVDLITLRELREAGLPYHLTATNCHLYDSSSLAAWQSADDAADRPKRLPRYSRPALVAGH